MLMELVFEVGSVYIRNLFSVSTGSDDRFRLCSVQCSCRSDSILSVTLGSCRWCSEVWLTIFLLLFRAASLLCDCMFWDALRFLQARMLVYR